MLKACSKFGARNESKCERHTTKRSDDKEKTKESVKKKNKKGR
jgi:hypothetical protein